MHKIRQALRDANVHGVEVATFDSFQGREKDFMLVHFVAAFDKANPFGFVHNANRLCVATTRAREFQFLFGNFSFWKRKLPMLRGDEAKEIGRAVIGEMMGFMDKKGLRVDWARVRLP